MNPEAMQELESVLRHKKSSSPTILRHRGISSSTPPRNSSPSPGFDFDTFCQDFGIHDATRSKLEKEDLTEAHIMAEVTEDELKEIGISLGQRKAVLMGVIYLKNASLERAVAKKDNMYSMRRAQEGTEITKSAQAGVQSSVACAKSPQAGAKGSPKGARSSLTGALSSQTGTRTPPKSSRSQSLSGAQSLPGHAKSSPKSKRSSLGFVLTSHRKSELEDSLDLFRKKNTKGEL